MWSGFQAKKLNARKECELAANQTEPENQAGPVPVPNPDQIKYLKFLFQKFKCTSVRCSQSAEW